MDDPAYETIPFEIWLGSEFWDQPGHVGIFIDECIYWQGEVLGDYQNPTIAKFHATLACGQPHQLVIDRQGKTQDQCIVDSNGIAKDQMIRLLKVSIDGINIQNKVWQCSWFEPEYSPHWIEENLSQGIQLDQQIIGETWWGHNGRWYLDFTSPFYRFIINDYR